MISHLFTKPLPTMATGLELPLYGPLNSFQSVKAIYPAGTPELTITLKKSGKLGLSYELNMPHPTLYPSQMMPESQEIKTAPTWGYSHIFTPGKHPGCGNFNYSGQSSARAVKPRSYLNWDTELGY